MLASALTTEVTLALPLLLWLCAGIHGLMAWTAFAGTSDPAARTWPNPNAGRLRYAAPALAACAAVVLTGLVVFAVVPHFGTGAFRPAMFRSRAVTGFSDTTRLGDIGRIKLDGSKVMEIDLAGDVPPEGELRWRGMVLNDGLRLVLAGLGLGVVGAMALSGLLTTQLFGVNPREPLIYVSVTMTLLVVGVAASFIPAWRATRVNPVTAMRAE